MTATILAICNQKGGVGKTTTTFHFARAAVCAGRKVLLVDADVQGNLTFAATEEQLSPDTVGLADVLTAHASETIRDVVVPGAWAGLDLVPTTGINLESVRDELVVAGAGREARLRTALADVADDYDLILIDCAPSLDQLTINSLAAADAAVIVTHSKLFSAEGLTRLISTIGLIQQHYNAELKVAGILVNQHEAGTISGRTALEDIAEAGEVTGIHVLDPPIPKKVVISDAIEAGIGLDEWKSPEATVFGDMYAGHLRTLELELEGAGR